jgi:hypothetical protein
MWFAKQSANDLAQLVKKLKLMKEAEEITNRAK